MSSVIVRKVIFKESSVPYRASKQSLSHLVSSNSCSVQGGFVPVFYGNFNPLVCSFMLKFQQNTQPQTVERSQGFSCCCLQQEEKSQGHLLEFSSHFLSEHQRMVTVTQGIITSDVVDTLLKSCKEVNVHFQQIEISNTALAGYVSICANTVLSS